MKRGLIVQGIVAVLALLWFLVVMWLAFPASADDDWLEGWLARSESQGLDALLVQEYVTRMAGLRDPATGSEPSQTILVAGSGMGDNSIDWSGLLYAWFPESEIPTALRIIRCESGGNKHAHNPQSGASGLFQVMPGWADYYGISRDQLFAAEVNVRIAYLIWRDHGGWKHWSCW